MANDVPPVPYKTRLTDQNGLLTVPWIAWFRQLFSRVGGNTGQALINPMIAIGDMIFGATDGDPARVSGNTAATKKFLTQTGTGSVSATPTWNQIASADLPAVTLTGDVTGSASGGSIPTTLATVGIGKGGTGQTTANAALNALLPSQTGNSGKFLKTNGSNTSWANPTLSLTAPTIQQFTSGSGTYTLPTNPSPLYLKVTVVGGGGGGGGGGASAGSSTGGGNSSFGTSLLTANGGSGGISDGASGGVAAGGTATVNASSTVIQLVADTGGSGSANGTGNSAPYTGGGAGGVNARGGNGGGGYVSDGTAGIANTGAGGGGGGIGNTTGGQAGNGGGAGGFLTAILTSPSSTYSYSIGAGGNGGSAGTTGYNGGNGGSGFILVEEYYQ